MTPGLWRVVPDERSTNMIHAICSAVISPEDLDNLHVTLAFDKNNPDNNIPLNRGKFQALISGVKIFGDNHDVLCLLWSRQTCKKSLPVFTPILMLRLITLLTALTLLL